MTEIDRLITRSRLRLTELQQDSRQGKHAEVLLGLLALGSELIRCVAEQNAQHLRRTR